MSPCAGESVGATTKEGGGVFAFEIATSNETGKTDWKGQFAMLKVMKSVIYSN